MMILTETKTKTKTRTKTKTKTKTETKTTSTVIVDAIQVRDGYSVTADLDTEYLLTAK